MPDFRKDKAFMEKCAKAYRTRISSTNPLERLIGEIKRRTDVVGILPNEAAIVRLVGALLLEQNSLETLAAIGHSDQLMLPAVAA